MSDRGEGVGWRMAQGEIGEMYHVRHLRLHVISFGKACSPHQNAQRAIKVEIQFYNSKIPTKKQ